MADHLSLAFTHFFGHIASKFMPYYPLAVPGEDLLCRAALSALSVLLLLLLQNLESLIRRLMRSTLDSYRYSGLLAFKAVWDEIENKNERGKLRQYLIAAVAADCLISFSLFRHLSIAGAFIAAPFVALTACALELHLVLSWFYNSKPFPVARNLMISRPVLALFAVSAIFSLLSLGCLYYRILPSLPLVKYPALLAIVSGAVSGAVLSPRLVLPDRSVRLLKRIDFGCAACFYIIPAAMLLLMSGKNLFMQISAPLDNFLHACFKAPGIMMPVMSVLLIMLFNASGSYLGHRLIKATPPVKNEDGQANPFSGRE